MARGGVFSGLSFSSLGLATVCLAIVCSTIVSSTTSARAQLTLDVTKITCREFLIGRVIPTDTIAIWFSGYYNGKRNTTTLDLSAVKPNAEKVKDYCALNLDETVMNAVTAVFGIK